MTQLVQKINLRTGTVIVIAKGGKEDGQEQK